MSKNKGQGRYDDPEPKPTPSANTLIVVGTPGARRCYLNVSEAEALNRYMDAEGPSPEMVKRKGLLTVFQFGDEFFAYDAWKPLSMTLPAK